MVTKTNVKSQSSRDELFRRIGRKVVACQYLEATLRSMIPALSNKGTLKELKANHKEVAHKHKTSSLGKLANAYQQNVYAKIDPDKVQADESLFEPRLASWVQIEVTPQKVASRKRALNKLIEEKNRLIHKDLLSVDLTHVKRAKHFVNDWISSTSELDANSSTSTRCELVFEKSRKTWSRYHVLGIPGARPWRE